MHRFFISSGAAASAATPPPATWTDSTFSNTKIFICIVGVGVVVDSTAHGLARSFDVDVFAYLLLHHAFYFHVFFDVFHVHPRNHCHWIRFNISTFIRTIFVFQRELNVREAFRMEKQKEEKQHSKKQRRRRRRIVRDGTFFMRVNCFLCFMLVFCVFKRHQYINRILT